jgi:hypothetical protein
LRVFILDNAGFTFHPLLLKDNTSNALGDVRHVEWVRNWSSLVRMAWNLMRSEITLGVLVEHNRIFQVFLLSPDLLERMNKSKLVLFDFIELLLALSDLMPLSLLTLRIGNKLRKSAFG